MACRQQGVEGVVEGTISTLGVAGRRLQRVERHGRQWEAGVYSVGGGGSGNAGLM